MTVLLCSRCIDKDAAMLLQRSSIGSASAAAASKQWQRGRDCGNETAAMLKSQLSFASYRRSVYNDIAIPDSGSDHLEHKKQHRTAEKTSRTAQSQAPLASATTTI